MSDTAFFARPAITPVTGANWLRLTEKAPAVSRRSIRPRWQLDRIPNLRELAQDLARGDRDATAELSRHLYEPTLALARALTPQQQNDIALAGLLTAQVLRQLRRHPSRWNTFHRWAPRLALSRGLKEMEAESSHLDKLPPKPDDLASLREFAENPTADSSITDADGSRVMSRLLSRLSPTHRVILTLTEIEGWSLAETKALFAWPKWLVSLRLFLARRSFDRLLKRWLDLSR